MSSANFSGIYPMQYAFFDRGGALDRAAMRRQVEAALAGGAHGVAVLGLATEVGKLSGDERRTLIDWIAHDVAGRVPVAVTVAGATVDEQVALAGHARAAGASWVILQPPPERGLPEAHYAQFFSRVMHRVQLPIAIQNAPEYIGVGLGDEALHALARSHDNFVLFKGEGPALAIRRSIEALNGALRVFNGRGGLELPDNLRAGCAGLIPATDTFDFQVRIFELMRAGDEARAEAVYREVLPAIVFAMQSLDTLICYGKRLAGLRLGLPEVHDRAPALAPTAFGLACVRRYAAALGPLA
ncbi:MAG TPA: dihydrodipicolinate synthase family protein [Burkholderiales bacterium]|jgi:4-hydroxy-tetrahydrodipicolinate synthase